MSANTAELTLIIRAQNLAEAEMAKVRTSLTKISVTAGTVARDVAASFKGIGKRIGSQFGNLAADILSGGRITDNLAYLGVVMAGAIVEGLSVHLIPMIMERVLATSAFAPIAAALEAGGLTLGSIFATAIAVGAAAFPFILLGLAIAALTYLIVNPEARQKAHDVALMIIGRIGDGLSALGKFVYQKFVDAFNVAKTAVPIFVGQVVSNILSIPDKIVQIAGGLVYQFKLAFFRVYYAVKKIIDAIIADIAGIPKAVGDALASLNLLNGKHDPNTQKILDKLYGKGHAAGGWVGLNGPELGLLGEKGPEYVVPNNRLGSMGSPVAQGVTIVGVTERQIVDMVDRGLYFKLQRAAPTIGRT